MLNKKGKRIHYLEVTTCEDNFCAVLAENIENVLNKLYKDLIKEGKERLTELEKEVNQKTQKAIEDLEEVKIKTASNLKKAKEKLNEELSKM